MSQVISAVTSMSHVLLHLSSGLDGEAFELGVLAGDAYAEAKSQLTAEVAGQREHPERGDRNNDRSGAHRTGRIVRSPEELARVYHRQRQVEDHMQQGGPPRSGAWLDGEEVEKSDHGGGEGAEDADRDQPP